MASASLKELIQQLNKQYKGNVAELGVPSLDYEGTLSLGSPSMDFCVYGSVPSCGRMFEFCGPEGSGKTSTAFLVAASYQQEELKRNPNHPRSILLVDNEGTADPVWAWKFGYDMNPDATVSTLSIRPEGQSAEEIFDMIITSLKSGEIGLIILDSIATLVPMQVMNESQQKKSMGGIAAPLTRFVNTIVGLLRKYRATFIGINQVRENMSGYGEPLITPGGRAWKHQCSLRLWFRQAEFFDGDRKLVAKKDAQSPAGHIVEVGVRKTKFCRWDRKLAYYHLNYATGIDKTWDLMDVAKKLGFIEEYSHAHYHIKDTVTGGYVKTKILDEKGKVTGYGDEAKPYGDGQILKFLDAPENKDVYDMLYNAVYAEMSIKDPGHTTSFEADRGMDLTAHFGFDMTTQDEDFSASEDDWLTSEKYNPETIDEAPETLEDDETL